MTRPVPPRARFNEAGSLSFRAQSQGVPLSEGSILRLRFGANEPSVGEEMRGWHRAPLLAHSTWAEALGVSVIAPITSATSDDGSTKVLFRAIPLGAGVSGQDRDGLILTAQADSIAAETLARLLNVGDAALTKSRLREDDRTSARRSLQSILVREPLVRTSHRLGTLTLSPGDVVLLKDGDTVTPWALVSNDIWLELCSLAYRHSRKLGGLTRAVAAFVPLFDYQAPCEELVVPIDRPQPGLPNGGHCRFHRLRTRSTGRIVSVEGPLEDDVLEAIALGLRCFLEGQ